METLGVDLGDRSYPIYIGSGLLDRLGDLLPTLAGKQVLVVTNTTIAPLYLDRVMAGLEGLQACGGSWGGPWGCLEGFWGVLSRPWDVWIASWLRLERV